MNSGKQQFYQPIHGISIGLVATMALGLPYLLSWFGQDYYLNLCSRILIFGLAATSLNLILGSAGLVSLGHAAFLGCGAYLSALCAQAGQFNLLVQLGLAALLSATLGYLIASVCLRTQGVYFIMITLAFAQMLYYLTLALRLTGGEDGINLPEKAQLWSELSGLDFNLDQHFYYLTLALFALIVWLLSQLLNSPFGRILQASKENPQRLLALGYHVSRFQLLAFVIAAAIAGLAGCLLANQNQLVSPNLLSWHESGNLLIMVLIGGVGQRWGGLTGAAVLLSAQEFLPAYSPHWQLYLGFCLLLIVLFFPAGLAGLSPRLIRHKTPNQEVRT